jgi:flagellar assembly protein FliH
MTPSFNANPLFEDDGAPKEVQPYVFPPLPEMKDAQRGTSAGRENAAWNAPDRPQNNSAPSRAQAVFTLEQTQALEKQALERGAQEGERRAREEMEKLREAERARLTQALDEFAHERSQYFQQVESEVVSLALSIARKILYREAQVDPLFLAGAVRVSLEKIAAGTHVQLRVHPSQVNSWKEFLAREIRIDPMPEVVADSSLNPVDCILETDLGSANLSLDAQLKEIEKGFLDLLAARPNKS